jgi:hypothetical protein
VGDGFDVHAALGRDDEGHAANRAIDQQRAVQLTGDVGAVFDVQAVDLLAGLARLGGDQGVAQHFLGVGDGFLDREGQTHAALGVGGQLHVADYGSGITGGTLAFATSVTGTYSVDVTAVGVGTYS